MIAVKVVEMPCPISECAHCNVTLPSGAIAMKALITAPRAAASCASSSSVPTRPASRMDALAAKPRTMSRRARRGADEKAVSVMGFPCWLPSLRAWSARPRPGVERGFEIVGRHWRRRSARAGLPRPPHQLVAGDVRDQIGDAAPAVLTAVEQGAAQLGLAETHPSHGGRRQMPMRRAGDSRHVVVVVLMTGTAAHHGHAAT